MGIGAPMVPAADTPEDSFGWDVHLSLPGVQAVGLWAGNSRETAL